MSECRPRGIWGPFGALAWRIRVLPTRLQETTLGLTLKFEHVDATGARYFPQEFPGGAFHTVEPGWLQKQPTRFSEANSDDVLLDHLKRGFHVWMAPIGGGPAKLVAPTEIAVRFVSE
jgi:hypothetical protein